MKEQIQNIPPKITKQEKAPTIPELIANPPLKETALIYSIPVRGEWKNGQLLRCLRGMFSQKQEIGQAIEIEIIANNGGIEAEKDSEETERLEEWAPGASARNSAKRAETEEVIAFLKKIVAVQRLSKKSDTDKEKNKQELTNIFTNTLDREQREVLELAAKQAEKVGVALIDTTKMDFENSPYRRANISSARTIGADMALTRFAGREEIPFSMYDIDTLPENTQTSKHIQALFARNPNLSYVFNGMADLPRGISKEYVSQANSSRHIDYNQGYIHGSPQICFRLGAYKKLHEISNLQLIGDEDRDTAIRLIYHFGRMQDGLLLEESLKTNRSIPTQLTSARIDGFMDGRAGKVTEGAAIRREQDLAEIITLRNQILKWINELPQEKQVLAKEVLDIARKDQTKRMQIQQRFNRILAKSFLQALEKNQIQMVDGSVEIDESSLSELPGGKALHIFLKNNPALTKELLASNEDIEALKYYAGVSKNLPPEINTPSRFQQALREYLGSVPSLADLESRGAFEVIEKQVNGQASLGTKDRRTRESRESLLHPMLAELLALGHTYRTFFSTNQFFEARSGTDTLNDQFIKKRWPKNPEEQKLDYHFSSQADRVEQLKTMIIEKERLEQEALKAKNPFEPKVEKPLSWWSSLSLPSFPSFQLFKKFFGKN